MGCGSSTGSRVGGLQDDNNKPVPQEKSTDSRVGGLQDDDNKPVPQEKSDASFDPEKAKLDHLRQTCLRAHNERRAKHGAGPLSLRDDLNEMAQEWADRLAKDGKFEHSSGDIAGENLAGNHTWDISTGEVITDMWYDEIKDYDFNKQGFSMATGHFTQVVWLSTNEIGVGAAKNKLGMYIYVANYYPAGNVMGSFEANVKPA